MLRILFAVVRFDPSAYRHVASSPAATLPSLIVVAMAAGGHAAWALARSAQEPGSADRLTVALAAISLEVLLFLALGAAIFTIARSSGRDIGVLSLLRPLGFAQAPAVLYVFGLLPPLTHFMPLLPLVLAWRLGTSVLVAVHIARLRLPVAVATVLAGAAAGVFLGFTAASCLYG
ncbi:MAG: hypothetical protein ACRDGE_05925 [Candidatus Limnocylindria bacterium]